jgi:hypothetical protein
MAPPAVRAQSTPLWQEAWTESNSLQRWETVANYHYHDEQIPCHGPNHVPATWSWNNGRVGIQLADDTPCKTVLVPQTLPTLPTPLVIEVDLTITQPIADRNVLVYWLDKDNYLGFHIFDQFVQVEERINGVSQAITPGSRWYTFQPNTTYHLAMEHHPLTGNIRLTINNELVINGYEQIRRFPHPLAGGKPGLGASTGAITNSETWFDNFVIRPALPGTQLNIPLLMQTDAQWKNQEYDSAHSWFSSDPGIGRWGCALTSAAMVFRYHQITTLPIPGELDPATLNTWLQQQPDGYLGNGNLNWQALSRLSYWHEQQYGTPALEFRYQAKPDNPLAWLGTEIAAGRPTILEEPGHFITTTRAGPGTDEIGINDPYYANRTSLLDYQQTFRSARVFTPSHTDLRTLMVLSPVPLAISAQNQEGQPVIPDVWWEPPPTDPETGQAGQPPLLIYSWPQANSADLEITVAGNQLNIPITLWRYDETGELIKNRDVLLPPMRTTETPPPNPSDQPVTMTITANPTDTTISISPNTLPWTTEELTWWWQWRRLPAPQLINLVHEEETKLQSAATWEDTQPLQMAWEARMQSIANQTPIVPLMIKLLNTHYQQVLLTLWP